MWGNMNEDELSLNKWRSYVNDLTSDVPPQRPITRSSSNEGVLNSQARDDVWKEFKNNGLDSPYDPETDSRRRVGFGRNLTGMGPSAEYLRQKSHSETERPTRYPRPQRHSYCYALDWQSYIADHQKQCKENNRSTEVQYSISPPVLYEKPQPQPAPPSHEDQLLKTLQSVHPNVLDTLFKAFEKLSAGKLRQECAFCKNNRERESMYKSHFLKDAYGHVQCPVLRAFRCGRCGATGDYAHTIKYCPYSTEEEKTMSHAVMRSVRMANGRVRERVPSTSQSMNCANEEMPLGPDWAAVEQMLLAEKRFKQ